MTGTKAVRGVSKGGGDTVGEDKQGEALGRKDAFGLGKRKTKKGKAEREKLSELGKEIKFKPKIQKL